MVKRKILIVDDEIVVAKELEGRLTRLGYEVAGIAPSEGAGFAMIARAAPDLVLMDMDLPGIDGWEATRRLRADKQTRMIPVIALTAHATQSDCDRAFQSGCDDFATKPIEFASLLGKISRALAGRPVEPAT